MNEEYNFRYQETERETEKYPQYPDNHRDPLSRPRNLHSSIVSHLCDDSCGDQEAEFAVEI